MAWHEAGQLTLRITIQENDTAITITLEGRVAGPWIAELSNAWREIAPKLSNRRLSIDLRNVIYSEPQGKQVLREIYAQTHATLVATTPWTEYLAQEITRSSDTNQEAGNGNHA
ncbi:MAG TPA: hypothetical protein VGG85_02630 [Terracidiphilus sp.]|jgi:hypothetical protein